MNHQAQFADPEPLPPLAARRVLLNLDRTAAAGRFGTTRWTLKSLEEGDVFPSNPSVFLRMSRTFGVPLATVVMESLATWCEKRGLADEFRKLAGEDSSNA